MWMGRIPFLLFCYDLQRSRAGASFGVIDRLPAAGVARKRGRGSLHPGMGRTAAPGVEGSSCTGLRGGCSSPVVTLALASPICFWFVFARTVVFVLTLYSAARHYDSTCFVFTLLCRKGEDDGEGENLHGAYYMPRMVCARGTNERTNTPLGKERKKNGEKYHGGACARGGTGGSGMPRTCEPDGVLMARVPCERGCALGRLRYSPCVCVCLVFN